MCGTFEFKNQYAVHSHCFMMYLQMASVHMYVALQQPLSI